MAKSWLRAGWLLALLVLSERTSAGVMDDGIKLAGQMFGINTAADVANLVAKAFSKVTTSQKQPDLMGVLQQGLETQRQQQLEQEEQDNDEQETEQENAQESPPTEGGSRRQPLKFNSIQMLTNMMRMIGFDPRKLGALALNAIVMIAQAIGSTIIQATRGGPADGPDTGPEAVFEPSEHQPRSLPAGSPIDWFLQRPGAHSQRMLRRIMDRELPEHLVDIIEAQESADGNEGACLKLLMCKSKPIIWGMQNSLEKRLAGQPVEPDEESYLNANAFFQHLPSLDEFQQHGKSCEARFAQHCPRNRTTPKLHKA